MLTGIVKRVKQDVGFGFITPDGGGQELFFHRTECATPFEQLSERQRVEYEETPSPKGPRAKNVRTVS